MMGGVGSESAWKIYDYKPKFEKMAKDLELWADAAWSQYLSSGYKPMADRSKRMKQMAKTIREFLK